MAIKSGFFNSVNGDRLYKADFFAEYFASFIANGVFPDPATGFQVVTNGDMSVNLRTGKAWINGYFITNDADYNLQLDVADGVLNRIDRIVLQLNYLNREIIPVVKKGTFASNPVAPTLQRDADAFEIALADIYINNGATSISQANITDLRFNNELCGIVKGVVDQIDTTDLFAQYDDAFQTWFESIQDILDGDVAGNLANQIAALEQTVNAHLAEKAKPNGYASLDENGNVPREQLGEIYDERVKLTGVSYTTSDTAFNASITYGQVFRPKVSFLLKSVFISLETADDVEVAIYKVDDNDVAELVYNKKFEGLSAGNQRINLNANLKKGQKYFIVKRNTARLARTSQTGVANFADDCIESLGRAQIDYNTGQLSNFSNAFWYWFYNWEVDISLQGQVDAVSELFMLGNNVKSDVVGALLSKDNSLPIDKYSRWADIINAISLLSIGGVDPEIFKDIIYSSSRYVHKDFYIGFGLNSISKYDKYGNLLERFDHPNTSIRFKTLCWEYVYANNGEIYDYSGNLIETGFPTTTDESYYAARRGVGTIRRGNSRGWYATNAKGTILLSVDHKYDDGLGGGYINDHYGIGMDRENGLHVFDAKTGSIIVEENDVNIGRMMANTWAISLL